jgi:O-acetyl-ADP-ribose deacetylase (regulator of RNase III)
MFEIHFIHLHSSFIDEMKQLFMNEKNTTYSVCDVKEMSIKNVAFVSPANSIGFMDGGIDYVYSRIMFPGLQQNLQKQIKNLGYTTFLGRPYLPIGSGIIIPVGLKTCIIACPTMFLPHDVSTTRNAYYAFMAALLCFKKYTKKHPTIKTLVCPALCTGYGKMSEKQAALQMYEAYQDFMKDIIPREVSHINEEWCYITENKDKEQPNNFDNREIKEIQPWEL